MSLRVWLPLNGDLTNNGLDNITVTNNGATVDNNGKIGKCYSFDGASQYLKETEYTNLGNNFSFATWFYSISNGAIVSTRSLGGAGFSIFILSGKFRIDGGIGTSSSDYQWTINNYNVPTLEWHHLTITRKNDTLSYYIDGIFQESKSIPYGDKYGNMLTIGCSQVNGSSFGNYFKGKLNDFRIYDHALSQVEINELAKGLVCHYKLDNDGKGGQDNIYDFQSVASKWLVEEGTTRENYTDSVYGNVLKVNTSSGNKRIYRGVSNVWKANQVYTVSFLAKADSTVVCNMSRSLIAGNFTENFTLTNEWKRYVGQINCTGDASGGTLSFQVTTTGVNAYITQIKLEYGEVATAYRPNINDPDYNKLGYNNTTVYDSSGNKYNSTNSQNLVISSDTPRNSVSTVFDGTSSKIDLPVMIPIGTKNSAMSFAFWVKRNNYTDGTRRYIYYSICSIYLHTDYKFRITWEHDTSSSSAGNTWAPGLLVPVNEWHHICFTFENGVMKVYYDGSLYSTSDRSSTGQFMGVLVQGGNIGDNQFGGSLSDFRIYSTALSADDVKELYQLGASIDKSGNVFAYEFKED